MAYELSAEERARFEPVARERAITVDALVAELARSAGTCPCHDLPHARCPLAEPCIGRCGRLTTAHESSACGYCAICGADPRWRPIVEDLESVPTTEGRRLVERRESGGLRHYLDGKPVHAGSMLELLEPDGSWLLGRYEWSFCRGDEPSFYLGVGQMRMLGADARLRWPAP